MRVLLTGGAGYIGSHTCVCLIQLGHQVVLYDNFSNSSRAVLNRILEITQEPIAFIQGDVRDTKLLTDTLKSYDIDAVINFAGYKAVGDSVIRPNDYYANNVQSAISLLSAMETQGIKMLVFSSSATVYGEPHYLPIDEGHSTNALSPYGRTKLHIEEMLRDIANADQGSSIVCLRYFNPVGAHVTGLIGENPKGVPNNLMPYVAQVAGGIRSELSVFGNDYSTSDGTGVRDYLHVMDLAEGHAAALNFLSENVGWHAVNLGTGKGYSVLELVSAFEVVSGRKIPLKIMPRRAGDVPACYADTQKAMELFKWEAKRTLEDMCASAWQFQQRSEWKDK